MTTRPLRVLVIADAKLPVPPDGYGGTERMVALLCEGLAARGHEVTLMAAKGSRNYGRLITHRWAGRKPYPYRAWCKISFQALSLWATRNVDVVINAGRVDYLWALLKTSIPILNRFDNPINRRNIEFLLLHRKQRLVLLSLSDHQRAHVSSMGQWRTVYNAVDTDRFIFSSRPESGYLAFLGRLTANKGVHVAIEVAQRSAMPLRIAGNVSDEADGRGFFEKHVRPHLGSGIEWIGPADDDVKIPFLQEASALLVPIQWEEPFGLVVAEALACGTPVIAMERASMPELIRHGVTGFLCRNADEMLHAVARIGDIDRRDCRYECERRFCADRMVEEYLEVAETLIGRSSKGRVA